MKDEHGGWETLLEELRTEFLLREQELELLHDIDLYILKDDTRLDETFRLIANRTKSLVGADHASVLLRRGRFLETTYSSDDVDVGERVAVEDSITGRCVTERICIIIEDIPNSEYSNIYSALASVSDKQMLSLVAIPVDINGDIVGVVCVESVRRAAFTDAHTHILNAIASQVAIALQRVQNFDRDKLFARLDSMMLEPSASQQMIQTALTEVISEIARLGVKAKGAQILFRKGNDELEIVHSTNESDITLSVAISDSICGRAVVERRTVVVGDVTKDPQYRRMLGSTIQSEIAVPLTLSNQGYVIGVLNVESEELDAFTGYYQIVLDAFADKVRILLAFAKLRADVTDSLEKRQATDLVATVGDQATNMVHRLNNQVGALRVHISDLLDENDQGKVTSGLELHDRLAEMLELARKTLRMPNEVTKIFSREGSAVDVNDSILNVLRSAYVPDGIDVITEFTPDLPHLSLYSFDLVIENLIKNAIQAIEEKGKPTLGKLTISTKVVSYAELPSGYVEVCIADTGSGIRQEVLPHIFDLNYSTKRSKSQGLGLGLWWVKNFIYRSDGEIKAYSTPGVGSKFVIKLPMSLPNGNLSQGKLVMSSDSVLVVDDEKSWRDIYEAAARRVGITTVRAAATLDAALAEIAARRFSVAVVDIGLDESDDTNVDGLAVLNKIRSVGDDTSILVITGRAGQDVISIISDAIKKYGAQGTMAKSVIETSTLRSAVEAGLETYRKSAASSHRPGYSELRGTGDQMIWDDRMMRLLGIDARELYTFVGKLVESLMPLLGSVSGATLGSRAQDGVAHGAFWSRAIGAPIVVLMGRESSVYDVMNDASDGGRLLGTYEVADVIRTHSESGAKGVVLRLANSARSDFTDGE